MPSKKDSVTPFVNSQKVESPLENWPGYIVIPVEVSPDDFETYWETYCTQRDSDDGRHETFQAWESRQHFVKDWKIEGLRHEQVTKDGRKMPSLKLMVWVISELQKVIFNSLSLPNLQEPSSDAETQSETA